MHRRFESEITAPIHRLDDDSSLRGVCHSRPVFICLTNIPTPYRLHFFHMLSNELEKRGWCFEVWFMAKSERGRYWQLAPDQFRFRHRFFRGLNFTVAGTPFHFNPAIPFSAFRNPPKIMLIAGGWGLLTNIVTTLQAKIRHHSALFFWSESHTSSSRQKNWSVNVLRSFCLRRYDAFAVPGKYALDYVQRHAPNMPIYFLPNTVDENLFRDDVLRHRAVKDEIRAGLSVAKGNRILLLPARLMPEKGIVPFLNTLASLCPSIKHRITLLIAGDGSLRQQLEAWVKQNPSLDVRILGHIAESEMIKLYAVADTFALPSLGDPNPLSVIEAMWAGLPLILSDRVGNHPEALHPGENGWLFNPECADAACEMLEEWMEASDEQLELQGRASAMIAEKRFKTASVVKRFLDQILDEASPCSVFPQTQNDLMNDGFRAEITSR